MINAVEIDAWNKVFENLALFKVKRSDRPNHPELMTILEAHPELTADFLAASKDPTAHRSWYLTLATILPAWMTQIRQKKAETAAKVRAPTLDAKRLRRIFRDQTENEPCSLIGVQYAIDTLGFTSEYIARLEAGLEDYDPEVEAEWAELRWKITNCLDEVP